MSSRQYTYVKPGYIAKNNNSMMNSEMQSTRIIHGQNLESLQSSLEKQYTTTNDS